MRGYPTCGWDVAYRHFEDQLATMVLDGIRGGRNQHHAWTAVKETFDLLIVHSLCTFVACFSECSFVFVDAC